MARDYQQFTSRGVRLVAISVDTRDESQQLASDLHIGFHLLRDADLMVADAYGVAMKGEDIAIPAVFIIDQDGVIRWSKIGESMFDRPSAERVIEQLDRLLAEPQQR